MTGYYNEFINLKIEIMELSVKNVITVYNALKEAKMSKMESADQIKLVKIFHKLKGIVVPYQDFVKDAQEKLKGENHEDIISKAQKWQQEGDNCDLSHEERVEINTYLMDYQKRQDECLKEEFEKLHEIEFDKLNEDSFGKLVASNDWTVGIVIDIQDLICA